MQTKFVIGAGVGIAVAIFVILIGSGDYSSSDFVESEKITFEDGSEFFPEQDRD